MTYSLCELCGSLSYCLIALGIGSVVGGIVGSFLSMALEVCIIFMYNVNLVVKEKIKNAVSTSTEERT